MTFSPVDDIPNLDKAKVNIKNIDRLLEDAINETKFALTYHKNLKQRNPYEKEFVHLLGEYLLLFVSTHKSLRVLLRHAFRNSEYNIVADAASLAREQVEKIYTTALLLEDPKLWLKKLLRSSWRKDFEEYLLRYEEQGHISRLKDYFRIEYRRYLESIRRPSGDAQIGPDILVSKFAMRVVEYKWHNPGGPKPTWFKRKGSIRDYLIEYFEFPTPGKAIKHFSNPDLRNFLTRWHKEYQFYCEFSHIALGKIIVPVISQARSTRAAEEVESISKADATRAMFTSYTAAATACALVLDKLTNRFGAVDATKVFWNELSNNSLMSKALWNMFVKNILQ